MKKKLNRILILSPHTDDGEFGCGGSIARFIEEGKEVFYVAFSTARKSVPNGFHKNILEAEVKKATAILGIQSEKLIILDYEVREFPKFRQKILDDMIKIGKEIKPDLVFLPSIFDTHQDHNIISNEGFRAFKTISMLGYELPWNNLTFNTSSFVFLEKRHLSKKVKSLKCYKSQTFRKYATEDFIRSLATTRGAQIGYQYAETFEVVRWIIK